MTFPVELTIDPEESVPRRIVWDLVEGDTDALNVRFTDLVLSDYDSIALNVQRDDGSKFSREVTPDDADDELGTVTWQAGDLVEGDHRAEFEFTSGSVIFTLPRRYAVELAVRKELG